MHRRLTILPAIATALVLGACADQALEPTTPAALAVAAPGSAASGVVPNQYIVVFRDDVRDPLGLADRLAEAHGGTVHFRYAHVLKGFAATLSPQAAEALKRNPNVREVAPDMVAELTTTQYSPPWGLDRMDQLDLPLSGSYTYGGTGAGVRAYVIDTGIAVGHPEFREGDTVRAVSGYDVNTGGTGEDCYGHGTHVAGIIGARTYGVAKAVQLVSVKVTSGCTGSIGYVTSSTSSRLLAGMNWVAADTAARRGRSAVANISLLVRDTTMSRYTFYDDAVRNLIARGVTVVAGAGNRGESACLGTPARVPEAITVAASTASDSRVINGTSRGVLWTSNHGPCVDLFAPGDQIPSTWYDPATMSYGTMIMGGTSMAAPHVTGYIARQLQTDTLATAATMSSYVVGSAIDRIVNEGPSTTRKLLYTPGRRRAVGS